MTDPTLDFYDREAEAYSAQCDRLGPSEQLPRFLASLPVSPKVLDLGCGSGRDAVRMVSAGCELTLTDGSAAMAAQCRKRLGLPVRVLRFEDLDYQSAFDGVWASASLLHAPRAALPDVLRRVYAALKPGGLLMASFKAGGQEKWDKLGRYYNHLDADEAEALFRAAGDWTSLEIERFEGGGYDGIATPWISVWAVRP
jgi:SAM-dependent methyltransferase